MNPKITEKEWIEDFKEFVNTNDAVVPTDVSDRILQFVHRELNPSTWLVFFKLLGLHTFVGTLSLAVCDQFGINPFNTNFSLAEYFMRFGQSVCMTLCGFIFISFSVVFGRLILRNEEFAVLEKNSAIQVFVLSVFSLVAFIAFGSEITLSIAVLWLLGATLGGVISTSILSARFTWIRT